VIEIRNLLFQPLTFQLAGNEHGLHLGSRQRKLVEDAEVSEEMRTAAKGGFVVLMTLEQSDQPEAQPVAAGAADGASENIVQPSEEPTADEPTQASDEAITESGDDGSGLDSETSEQSEETTSEPRSRKRR
jgi:hypothetical protein